MTTTDTEPTPQDHPGTGAISMIAEPPADTGRHSVARPLPAPPEEQAPAGASHEPDGSARTPDPSTAPDFAPTAAELHDAAAPAPGSPAGVASAAPPAVGQPTAGLSASGLSASGQPTSGQSTLPDPAAGAVAAGADPSPVAQPPAAPPLDTTGPAEPSYDFPDPHPPRAPGWGQHVLGALLGLVLPTIGAAAVLLGQSRVLSVQAPHWSDQVEWVGVGLTLLGVAILVGVVLLARWTASVAITGGVLLTAAGLFALVSPGYFHPLVMRLLESEGWVVTLRETVVAATSGTLLVAGALTLAAGIAAARTRKHGLRLGAYRERNRDA